MTGSLSDELQIPKHRRAMYTFPGRLCKIHNAGERYLDTRRCVICQGEPTPFKPPKIKIKKKRKSKTPTDPVELRHYERMRRGMPRPTRPETSCCELCGRPATKTLHLDHCHNKKTFRGWLCGRCNTGLGLLGDTREAVQKALLYFDMVECEIERTEELRTLSAQKSNSPRSGSVNSPCQGDALPLS